MAPRGDAARVSRGRRTSLQKLLQVAHAVLEASSTGADPVLSSLDLSVAERAAEDLGEQLRAKQPIPEIIELWERQGQDLAALVALFALALRRSSPFGVGERPLPAFAEIRQTLSTVLLKHGQLNGPSRHIVVCEDLLAPVLLRADTLECYSRLLAEAAEQLNPAAASVPCAAMGSNLGSSSQLDHRATGAAAAEWHGRQTQQHQRHGPRGPQPSLSRLENLLREVFCALSIVGLLKPRHYATDAHAAASISKAASPSSSSSSGGGSGSSTSGAQPPRDNLPMHDVRSRLQSSWVLEHWARVLLLGTAPALAGGDSKQQQNAQALQASLMHGLCKLLCAGGLDWAGFLARPCGGTLAAFHMAHLCSALDGGHAFGLPRPQLLVLPASRRTDRQHLDKVCSTASHYDAVLVGRGGAVSLHTAVYIVDAWRKQLEEAVNLALRPGVVGPGAAGHGGAQRAGADVEQEGSGEQAGSVEQAGSGEEVEEAEVASGTPGPSGNDAGASGGGMAPAAPFALASCGPCRLPPHDRAATITVCLRLAKGVLACWGKPLAGVRLELPGHAIGGGDALLPVGNGIALLYSALACARLALLPDVWGRARVRGRVRAQLRAWWETYVAAARHPEALVLGKPDHVLYPLWTYQGGSTQPSADSAAALEAGLLPCMAALVTRMGAAHMRADSNGSALLFPPELFPGANSCWTGVLLHGPPGQVGQLVSALVLRLHRAADELTTAVASGAEAEGRRGGRFADVPWQADILREVVHFTHSRTAELVRCLAEEDDVETNPAGAVAGSGGRAGRLDLAPAGPLDGSQDMRGVQATYAVVEMLPALSRGLEACAWMQRWGLQARARARGQKAAAAAAGKVQDETEEALARLAEYGVRWAVDILECVSLLLAKDGMDGLAVASERRGSSSGAGGAGGAGDEGGAGGAGGVGGADGGGDGAAAASAAPWKLSFVGWAAAAMRSMSSLVSMPSMGATEVQDVGSAAAAAAAAPPASPVAAGGGSSGGGADSPWRQLLLREVRLMQLLGAAVELACGTQELEAGGRMMDMATCTPSPERRTLCEALARLMPVAAAAFPAQFRAAVGLGAAAEGDEAAAAAGTGYLAGGASSSTGTPPGAQCIVLPDALAALRVGSGAINLSYDSRDVVTRVAEGWDPTLEESQSMACSRWQLGVAGTGEWVSRMQLLLSPEEARAVFLAAAAADAGLE